MEDLTVQRILDTKGNNDVFTIPVGMSITELVRHACERNVGALLVRDENGKLVGIISERDIMRQLNAGIDFDQTPAAEIMTRDLITITPDDDMHMAMDLMVSKRIRHLPIVSGDDVAGLITVRDLIHAIRVADENETQLLVEYLQKTLTEETAN